MAKAIINGNEIFGNVHLGEGGDVANPNIADVYDPTQTYNTGDRRIYDDVLYVCNDDNVTGAWDSTKWDSATIDEIISALTAADIPYSAGVSVADKLDSLSDIKTYTCAYVVTNLGGGLSAISIGKVVLISGYMWNGTGANITSGTTIGKISNITLSQELFASSIGSGSNNLRIVARTNGDIDIEKNLVPNEWFSFTVMGFLT